MSKEVFKRKELKYKITAFHYQMLIAVLQEHMVLDAHNEEGNAYSVHTLYLDTDTHAWIRNSLSKPKYKEKLRIRSYQPFTTNSYVYLEMKKKYKGMGNKRRITMSLSEALHFIHTGWVERKEYMDGQVLQEMEYMLAKEKVGIKTYIQYERVAYVGIEDPKLRITFDNQIRSKREGKEIFLLDQEYYLMEIKVDGSMPLWLTRFLSIHEMYRTSFSKYGTEYQKYLAGDYQQQQTYHVKENNYVGIHL